MHPHVPLQSAARRGITLLEVLIAMFVLAVGILSIFALFTAGREVESRAAIKSSAVGFAAAQRQAIGEQGLAWQQWLRCGNPTITGSFCWASTSPNPIVLPVIVDPWGLCTDGTVRQPGAERWDAEPFAPVVYWDWSRFVPLASDATAGADEPFQRVTLPMTERTPPFSNPNPIAPLPREAAVASFCDEDAIEYRLSPNADDPPLNAFEAGRRKRGSDLIPALFIAAANPLANSMASGTRVKRSLLVFHKPVPDFESTEEPRMSWPSGVVELRVVRHETGLIKARLSKTPKDLTVVRRSLKPGKWVLFTNRLPRPGGPPYYYDTAWRELTSVTQDETDGSWLIVPRKDLSSDSVVWPTTPDGPVTEWRTSYPDPADPIFRAYSPIYCYAFEHLVHVDEFDASGGTTLP